MTIDRVPFMTNIPLIDRQHNRYLDLVEELFNRNEEAEDDNRILEKCISEILDYSGEHFDAEEFLMRSSDYPFYDEHTEKHNTFREKVDSLLFSMDSNLENVQELLDELRQWLIEWFKIQVLEDDLKLAEFLIAKKNV